MAKISSYDNASPVSLTDKIIGTSVGAVPANATKNFLLSDLLTLFQGSITLSNVLTAGNTATNNIVLTGNISCTDLTASRDIAGLTVTANTITASVALNAATATVSGLCAAASITSATTIAATGEVSGGTANIAGRVDAQRVFVVQGVDAASITVNSISAQAGNHLSMSSLPAFADNNTAKQPTGPLSVGDVYVTDGNGALAAGFLMVVV
tara:strand:+ start:218 stop:847 length:630 start_codon:yes stop_codon:yes gene_type:complete